MNIISIRVRKSFFFYTLGFIFLTAPFAKAVPAGTSIPPEPEYKKANDRFKALAERYGLKSCAERNSEEIEDKNTSICENEDDYFYSKLVEKCKSEKKTTTKCCEDPSACTNIGAKIAQGALTLGPSLVYTIKSYKTSKKISKDENLTAQQKSDALCSASNKTIMAGFIGQLMGQLMPYFEKDCAKKIKQCKNSCNTNITAFKQELRDAFNELITGNIHHNIRFAKRCLYNDEGKEWDDISFKKSSSTAIPSKAFSFGSKNLEASDVSQTCKVDITIKEAVEDKTPDLNSIQFFSQVLFYAKAYQNSMKEKKEKFAFNEKEIIDCGHQPNRIVTPSKERPQITRPMLNACNQIAEQVYSQNPKAPSENSVTVPNSQAGLGGFQGTSLNMPGHPLLNNGGDTEGGEELPPSEGLYDKPKPSLSENLPSFGEGASGSGSLAGGGVSAGGGGGGGSGTDSPEGGDYYDDIPNGLGSFGGGFSGGYDNSDNAMFSETGGSYLGDREVANDEDDGEGAGGAYHGGDDDFANTEESSGSIFEMASKRIQFFCSNLKCKL